MTLFFATSVLPARYGSQPVMADLATNLEGLFATEIYSGLIPKGVGKSRALPLSMRSKNV